MKKFIAAALALFFASTADAKIMAVADRIVPIFEKQGVDYKVTEDLEIMVGDEYFEWPWAAYGNMLDVSSGQNGWSSVVDPKGGKTLGYARTSAFVEVPNYQRMDETEYIVMVDSPELRLTPFDDSERSQLSSTGFSLIRGEIVIAVGRAEVETTDWLLLVFGTNNLSGGPGVGEARYAWAKANDLFPLASYQPVNDAPPGERVPARARTIYGPQTDSAARELDRSYHAIETEELHPTAILSGHLRERLMRDGIALSRAPTILRSLSADDLADLYASTGTYTTDFITVDLFAHVYHLFFERMLKDAEINSFAPRLAEVLSEASAALIAQKVPSGIAAPKAIAVDLLSAAMILNGADVDASERAKSEAALAQAASGVSKSPITGAMTDWTQYRPRGHYDGDAVLERYFRAMSLMGGEGIQLVDTSSGAPIEDAVAAASLIVLALDSTGEKWNDFSEPIDFLMGKPDDGDLATFREVITSFVPSLADASALADRATLREIGLALIEALPSPMIRDRKSGTSNAEDERASRGREFRMSGKRFTFDAYAISELTSPRVGSDISPRNMPKGTDVAAVLGSRAAIELSSVDGTIPGYAEAQARLRAEAPNEIRDEPDTAYNAWLRALEAEFSEAARGQFFTTTRAWGAKRLMTGLASYAELKHDTVLYAKQGGAEAGGPDYRAGEFAPPSPRGYVEPMPQTFEAIRDAASALAALDERLALSSRPEWGESLGEKMLRFADICESMRRIAEAEVNEWPISAEDYAAIKDAARSFVPQFLFPSGFDWGETDHLRMAIVTDIATDFLGGRVLQIGTGAPREIFVHVDDRSGGSRVARGWTYSYYEFERSLSDGRMTDAEWRNIVYDPSRADELDELRPSWYGSLD